MPEMTYNDLNVRVIGNVHVQINDEQLGILQVQCINVHVQWTCRYNVHDTAFIE